jgi:hypothetical protein
MLFVGDHPLFDEPRDPRVVFHLEPCGLSRPAAELTRLVLYLREVGGGSLRRGFDRLGRPAAWWKKLWPVAGVPGDGLVRRWVPRVGDLVMVARPDGCPVIGFEKPPNPAGTPTEHCFVPADLAARMKEG